MSDELADEFRRLVARLAGLVDRRVLSGLVGWVMSTAAGGLISLDEWDRRTAVTEAPRRLDAPTIDSLSMFLQQCKHQDDHGAERPLIRTVLQGQADVHP